MEEDRDLTNVKGALIWVLQYLFLTSESLLIAHSNDPEKRVFDDILLRCVCQHRCEREPRKRVGGKWSSASVCCLNPAKPSTLRAGVVVCFWTTLIRLCEPTHKCTQD